MAASETSVKADPELVKQLVAAIAEQVRVLTCGQTGRTAEFTNHRQLCSAHHLHVTAASPLCQSFASRCRVNHWGGVRWGGVWGEIRAGGGGAALRHGFSVSRAD